MKVFCRVIIACVVLLLSTGCSTDKADLSFKSNSKKLDVIGEDVVDKNQSINIDIYLDATTSMSGFSKVSDGVFNNFLYDMDGAFVCWNKATVSYYKFGTKTKRLDSRNDFLKAKEQSFYAEKGIFEKTNIDSVISKADKNKISMIITDLFQNDGDVNSLVTYIKDNCFARGIDFSVLAIPSDYEGKIFDSKVPTFPYASKKGLMDSYRPFYVVMLGKYQNIKYLYNSIKSSVRDKQVMLDENLLIISKYLVDDYSVSLNKVKGNKNIILNKSKDPNTFKVSIKDIKQEEIFEVDIELKSKDFLPYFDAKSLELLAYKKTSVKSPTKNVVADSSVTAEMKLISSELKGNKLSLKTSIKISDPNKSQSYLVYVSLPKLNAFMAPKIVTKYSSDNPTPIMSPNKTLNLDKFIMGLFNAYSANQSIFLAKYCLTITEK